MMLYSALKDLVRPLPLLFLLHAVGLALLWRRSRRPSVEGGPRPNRRLVRFLTGSFVLLYLACTEMAAYPFLGALERPYPPLASRPKDVAAIVVLGGGGGPPFPGRRRPELGEESIDRCLEAAAMYHDGPPIPVIATGGQPETSDWFPAHAATMVDLLVRHGVDPADAIVEPRALTTYENAVETAAILRDRGLDRRKILLVTQASHMARGMACFRKQGLDPVPASCRPLVGEFGDRLEFFLPSPGGLRMTRTAWNEWLGLLWYRLRGKI